MSDADGSHPVQLTTFGGGQAGTPRWSPDGRRLVFDSTQAGNWDLHVMDVAGGTPRRLTTEPSEEGTPTWSRDGRFIYFHSDRGGRFELWKMPSEGGAAVQVTHGGGFYGVESPDGRFIYYANQRFNPGIWRIPTAGGEPIEIVKGPIVWSNWALGARGLYYLTSEDRPGNKYGYVIRYLDVDSRQVTPLFHREGRIEEMWLTVSPDETWILYSEAPWATSEIMLVESFR
jgi:eukaryotic-like serine/threonine-protein kinase